MVTHSMVPIAANRPALGDRTMGPSREDLLSNNELSLRLLLFRYFWPSFLFRDASKGNLYARAAAYQHNREMSVHLPIYLKRWAVMCVLALGAVFLCDRIEKNSELYKDVYAVLTAGAGMVFTCCFAFACIIASIYARLRFEDIP
jgi:hypothetical protein